MSNIVIESMLGIDYGEVRVGVSGLESNSRRAIPVTTFSRQRAESGILGLVSQYGITLLIVGLPLSSDNEESPLCGRIRSFCRRLKRRSAVEVHFEDEYLSSEEAIEVVRSSGKRESQSLRKTGLIDAQAATLILQRYLDRHPEHQNK